MHGLTSREQTTYLRGSARSAKALEEQKKKMEELSQSSYSAEAREKLRQRGPWTEQDQHRAQEQWAYLATEADLEG